MITFRQIGACVGADPFRPFRIKTAGGQTFEIRHPEMIRVGRSSVVIYTFFDTEADETHPHQVEVSLLLTESIEPLETAAGA